MTWGPLLRLAVGHLWQRKRQSLVSVLGVALGVGFFIAMATLMRGFEKDFIERIINTQPHIVMEDEYRAARPQPIEGVLPPGPRALSIEGVRPREEARGIRQAQAILERLNENPNIEAAPVLTGQVFLRYGGREEAVSLAGIEPDAQLRISSLEEDMIEGSLRDLNATANGIVLGRGVALDLGVGVGDTLVVASAFAVTLRMTVVGIFETGITTLDNSTGFALLKKVQVLQQRPRVVNEIRIRLSAVNEATPMARAIEARYGYFTQSWEEANQEIMGVFVIQQAIMFTVTGAILIVACFGIFNTISTAIFEKTRDIAILKAIGFPARDMRRLFALEGLAAGLLGSFAGWAVGWALVEGLGQIRFDIEGMVRVERFALDRNFLYYLIGAAAATLASTFAAWIPARRAAGLDPVAILRGAV